MVIAPAQHETPARATRMVAMVLLGLCLLWVTGCQVQNRAIQPYAARGELGTAREMLLAKQPMDRADRTYLLNRMDLAIATLDEGYPQLAQPTFEQVYELLRTQGINQDKTVASVVLNEDLKFWKGEPFEQALAMMYYGLQQAAMGQWDNTRAAAQSALFNLRDYSGTTGSGPAKAAPIDAQSLLQKAIEYENKAAGKAAENAPPKDAASNLPQRDYLNSGYAVRQSNFTLGYLLNALANKQLGRVEEARDNFAVALEINKALRPLIDQLDSDRYNTVLVVSYGLGPAKTAYGTDNALVRFVAQTPGDNAHLVSYVTDSNGQVQDRRIWPVVTDVNAMAADHQWNSLEDVRNAKSLIGSLLMLTGAGATVYGIDRSHEGALYAGLGAMAAGAFLKAGAHADTRQSLLLPQRFYLVPLQLGEQPMQVHLQVEGKPSSKLVLAGLQAPEDRIVQLRSVRLVSTTSQGNATSWATGGRVYYNNEVTGQATYQATGITTNLDYPFVLGGRGIEPASVAAMNHYQAQGYLQGITSLELGSMYRSEKLVSALPDAAIAGRHVLEGGRLLLTPQAGTLGFARLLGQWHPPYRPQSEPIKTLANQIVPQPLTLPPRYTQTTHGDSNP